MLAPTARRPPRVSRVDRLAAFLSAARPASAVSLLILVLAAYGLLAVGSLLPRQAIDNLDFWYQVELGQRADLGDPATLSDGLYPIGYPLLLRAAVADGVDVLRFAHVLSWLGGGLALAAAFGLAQAGTGSTAAGLIGATALLLNPLFLVHATQEGNHMLAAGLQALAVLLLWPVAAGRGRSAAALAGAAGLVLGLAYLTRYPALVLVPLGLAYLLWKAGPRLAGLFLGGFAAAAAPQLVPSLLAHGNPFHNAQAKNVWFGIYGGGDWVANWPKAPDDSSLLDVVALDPERFFRHWAGEVVGFVNAPDPWPPLLYCGWIVGAALLPFARGVPAPNRWLLLGLLALPVLATAMAWLAPHFLLAPLVAQAALIGFAAQRAARAAGRAAGMEGGLVGLVLVAGAVMQLGGVEDWLRQPPRREPLEVHALLRLAGLQRPDEVATNDGYLHAVDRPDRARYAQLYETLPRPESWASLRAHARSRGWNYLVLDRAAGLQELDALGDGWATDPGVVPLRVGQEQVELCLDPCRPRPEDRAAPAVELDNGMRLVGHRLFERAGRWAVLLFWEATRPIERSYKVSVRTVDRGGRIAMQQDAVPRGWRFPTERWPVGVVLGDFYDLGRENVCPDRCELAVVVYDQASGRPARAGDRESIRLGEVRAEWAPP